MRRFLSFTFYSCLWILILFSAPFGCNDEKSSFSGNTPSFNTPLLLSSGSSSADLEDILRLTGKLELFRLDKNGNPNLERELDLQVEWVPRNPDRSDSPKIVQVIPPDGLKIDHLKQGDYLFKILLNHQWSPTEKVLIASIEAKANIQNGRDTAADFSQSSWNYEYDDDQDRYTNIAEITNGYYSADDNGNGDNSFWVLEQTNPKDPNSHPSDKAVLASKRIGSTSPDDQGNVTIIGDPRSVQSGTKFILIHYRKDGSVAERISFNSRIDGSFEVNLKNAEKDERIAIIPASKLSDDQNPDLGTIDDKSGNGAILSIQYQPIKMVQCGSVPGKDPVAGNGYAIFEGEGISFNASQNEVFFPKVNGGFVQSTDVTVSGRSSKTVELVARIPAEAISGFPYLHTKTPNIESYGICPKNQDVIVIQNSGRNDPDLYITLVDVPFVLLLGQVTSFDIHLVNQGLRAVENSLFFHDTYISSVVAHSPHVDIISQEPEGEDREIFPGSLDWGRSSNGRIPQINSVVPKGGLIHAKNNFFISKLIRPGKDPYLGSILFKAEADPLSGGIFGGGNNVIEQDEVNNSRAADHNTFIHSVDLDFLRDGSGRRIDKIQFNSKDLSLEVVENTNYTKVKPADGAQSLELFKSASLNLSVGKLFNHGSFPLIRLKDDPKNVQYVPDTQKYSAPEYSKDPLNTLGESYLKAKSIVTSKNYGDSTIDLQRLSAQQMVDEVSLINERMGYPVVIHPYYSVDEKFVPSIAYAERGDLIDHPLPCETKECCFNRLSTQESIQTDKLDLKFSLDQANLLPGAGYLFLVAEVIQLDPKKIASIQARDTNGDIDYCGALPAERAEKFELIYSGGENSTPLLDNNPFDNIVMIPIIAAAADLRISNLQSTPTTIVLKNPAFPATFETSMLIDNIGNLKSTPTKIRVSVEDKNLGDQPLLAMEGFKNGAPPPAPVIVKSKISISDPDNFPMGQNLKLSAKIDPDGTDVYEASRDPRAGKKNNSAEIPINITAPDLVIYGLGFSDCGADKSCKSLATPFNGRIDSTLGDSFNLDVYVKNIGTGDASKDYTIQVEGVGTSCPLKSSVVGSPIPSKQWARIPLKVEVPRGGNCKANGNSGSPNGFDFSISLIENSGTGFYQRAIGANGRSTALSNDKIVNGGKNGYFRVKPGIDLPKEGESQAEGTLGSYFDTTASGEVPRFYIGQPEFDIKDQTFDLSLCTVQKDCIAGYPVKTKIKIANHGDGVGRNVVLRPVLYDGARLANTQPEDIIISNISISDTAQEYEIVVKLHPSEHIGGSDYKLQFEINPSGEKHIAELAKEQPVGTAEPLNNLSKLSDIFPIGFIDYSINLNLNKSSPYKVSESLDATVTVKNNGTHRNVEDIEVDLYYDDKNKIKNKERFVTKGDDTFKSGATITKIFSFNTPSTGIRPIPQLKAIFFPGDGTTKISTSTFRVDADIAKPVLILDPVRNPYFIRNNVVLTADCSDSEGDELTYTFYDSAVGYGPEHFFGCQGVDFPMTYPGTGADAHSSYQSKSNTTVCHLDTKSNTGKRLGDGTTGVDLKVMCDDNGDAYAPKASDVKHIEVNHDG